MSNLFTSLLLQNEPVATWISNSFPFIKGILIILMVLCCIAIIVGVLVSPPQTGAGNNVITGASESYYTKNKSKNNQGRIKWMIIGCAITVAVSAVLYFIAYGIYSGW